MFSETIVLDYITSIVILTFFASMIYNLYTDYFKRGEKMTDDQLMSRFLFIEKRQKKAFFKKG